MSATNAVIALALILDFSGSMEQKLEDKTKRAILADNIGALASSLKQEDKTLVISFGSGTSRGCDSVETHSMPVGELADWTKAQRPGNYASTPLARAIGALSSVAVNGIVSRSIIITDGHDTCGQDPCKALEDMDQALNKQIRVDLLGYDIDAGEASKLKCEKSKFKNIRFNTYFAGSDTEFAKHLETIESTSRASAIVAGEASLEIQSAPATATFIAAYRPKRQPRSRKISHGVVNTPSPLPTEKPVKDVRWKGAYPIGLKPGDYEISTPDFEGTRTKISIASNERKQVNFYWLFRLPKAVLGLKENHILGLRALPLDGQNGGRSLKIVTPKEAELFPGRWKLSIEYPSWLPESPIEITLEPASNRTLSLASLFRKHIQWIDTPKKESVLLLESDGRERRVLVMPDPPWLPVPKQAKWRWLPSREQQRSQSNEH